MTKQTIKTGTRIEVLQGSGQTERATIARWRKVNGPVPNMVGELGGWHVVQYDDGGKLLVHEGGFRVIDNRAA